MAKIHRAKIRLFTLGVGDTKARGNVDLLLMTNEVFVTLSGENPIYKRLVMRTMRCHTRVALCGVCSDMCNRLADSVWLFMANVPVGFALGGIPQGLNQAKESFSCRAKTRDGESGSTSIAWLYLDEDHVMG
jgi:hypothetical protein